MKVVILSRNKNLYSTHRLVELATDQDVAGIIFKFIETKGKPENTRTRGIG